ncbi:MAG: hypothetical protein JOZ46_02685 [Candidatus Dormibacteraeota bacterium]|nr:hypothetical protein [Candidatus Dormibacteraeota bacterium]MBV9524705.1 hypothetical protein [Candidatus Dormibacteraeota bacterium]
MALAVDDLAARIRAALVGAVVGEAAAGIAAGGADLLGVAESVAATGGFDEADLRHRGLERPSRAGPAGLLLRALPFGLLTPLDRPRLRRDAYRCVALAGADEGTTLTAIAAAILVADLTRFDLETALVRVRQSLLEDAPMALLQRLSIAAEPPAAAETDPGSVLQAALAAAHGAEHASGAVGRAAGQPAVALALAGALAGAAAGAEAIADVEIDRVPHAELAVQVAQRLAERAASLSPRVLEPHTSSG